jgi:hypothetical protein
LGGSDRRGLIVRQLAHLTTIPRQRDNPESRQIEVKELNPLTRPRLYRADKRIIQLALRHQFCSVSGNNRATKFTGVRMFSKEQNIAEDWQFIK